MTRSILLVLTSASHMGSFPRPTGYWVEEAAVPYYVFSDAGYDVALASPLGGTPPRDTESEKPEYYPAACARFDVDPQAQDALRATLPLASIQAQDYAAVFFAGGHGTMVDFPTDAQVIRTVETFFATGRPVASVCHGPACLVGAKTPDRAPIIAGRAFTCFTDEEEHLAEGAAHVPFLLQARLETQGGLFRGGTAFAPCAVADGLLITGQNPASAAAAAQHVLSALR